MSSSAEGSAVVHEGDTVTFFCPEAKGFVFSQSPSSSFSHVTIFPVANPERKAQLKDPVFPSVHFATFQVLAENANINLKKTSPLDVPRKNNNDFIRRSLVYGRKIKLLHVASKKYLSLDSIDGSGSVNKTATLVDEEYKKDTLLFRILPSRPTKHRGEDVMSQDQIKLESVNEKGHHVLCALNTLTGKYELKMAVTDSVFVISSQSKARAKMPHKALRGCDVVMLFNFKREAYLAGRGSIVTQVLPEDIKEDIVTEVGARKRETVHGIQKAPPISGDCFWQLERADAPLNGDQFKYGDQCRIKHLPTQEYIAVVQKGQKHLMTLKKLEPGMPLDTETTFSLVSVVGQTGGVLKGNYVELRHVQSAKNLSVLSKGFLQRTFSSESSLEVSQSKWFKLGLEDSDQSRQQYFRVEEVNSDLIHEYYHISGVTAVLKDYMYKFTADPKPIPFPPALDEPQEVLVNLSEWMKDEHSHKSRANMLRVSQGVDLLVGFLYEIEELHDYKELRKLCEKVSLVLQSYVQSSNRKSHLYLSEKRFMDVMFKKIGIGIGIEKVLSTLVKDESGITEKVVTRLTESSNFTQRILKNLDSSILNFLSTLCFTAGKPARNLQNIIREKVVANGEDSFIRTEVINGVVCFASPEQIKGPIVQICSKQNLEGANKKMFEFFVSQLKLFSRICKGVNLTSINMICKEKKFITFEEALICINDTDLHPLLQSAYLDFVTSAYVDRNVEESGTDIDNIWHSYFWDEICPNPMQAAGLGDTFEAIPDKDEIKALQSSIRSFLSKNKVLYSKEDVDGHNELLVQMLAVMEPLVSYGFYWKDEEINEITKFLIDIIDGNHDRPKPYASPFELVRYQQKKRYKNNERNKKVFRVKTKAVRILHLLFKMLVYTTLGKLTFDFKFLKSDMEISSTDDYSPVNSSLIALLDEDYQLNDQEPEIVDVARRRLRKLFAEQAYKSFDMNESEGHALIKILLDLLKYQDDELRLSSILLLFDIFQEENILFNDASISYIVTPPSAEVYWDMVISGSFSDENKCLLRLVQGTVIDASGDDDDNELHEEVVGVLESVKEVCAVDEDETQHHACNQGIVFSTGVFSAILTYVLQFCSTNNEEQIPLLKLACSALQAVVRKNPQVQNKVFASFMDFLDVKIAVAPVARLLTDTVTDNPLLCRNLSESDIKQLLGLAATGSSSEYYDFFTTLEAVMKPYKTYKVVPLLLKNYQEVIARTFTEQRHEYFSRMFFSDGNDIRVKILKEADSDDDRLLRLLAVSDLLATTSEGQCKYAEDVCQTTFALEDLVGIISSLDIEVDRKKPFARLLNWSYLNTERDSLVSIAALSKNSLFWAHLEECSLLMDSFCNKMSEDGTNNDKIKVEIRVLFARHISFTAWRERCESKGEEEEEEDQILLQCGDKNIPLYSFLIYLIDGLIPLVTSFCAQLAAHTSSGLTSKIYSSLLTPSIVAVLKTLSDSVVKLLKAHPEVLLTTPQQVNHWTKCMDVLVFMLPPEQTEELNEVREAAYSNDDYFTSPALREYESELEEERIMNFEFQNFITNFKITYEGRNPVDNSQENILHDDEDDLVPAGTSFKELVTLFTDNINPDNTCTLTKTDSLLQLMDILYRQLQQPLTSKERANLDYVLLTSLQILSGVMHTKIDSIDPQLQSNNPEVFRQEYDNKVKPLQDALVELKSHEKVMIHLAHPKDEIAVQVLAFLRVLLYLGNENAQKKIGNLTSHRDTKFFLRLNQLLESVVSSIGQPLSRTLRFTRQTSTTSQISLPPPPPTDSAPPTGATPTEKDTKETKEGGEEGGNPFQTSLKKLAEEFQETKAPVRPMSMSNDSDDNWDDYYEDDEDEDEEDETDFGGIEKRTIQTYTMEGAGQLETSEADAKKRASVVLDVVAWICDGQNKDMQNILRKQDTALTNVNIVGAVAVLLQTLAEHFSEKTSRSTQKAIQALIEVCAGNFTNQEVAFKGQIVDSINIILRFSNFLHTSEDKTELLRVKASAIELLEVMIEETDENSKLLAEGISQDLSVEDLMDTLGEFWELCNDNSLQLKTEAKRAMFRGYHVLKRIADYMGKHINEYVDFEEYDWDDDIVNMWQHLSDSSRSIEINYVTQNQEEILTKVYFPFDPSRDLTEDEKEVVKNNIKRDSPEDKVKDLLEWMESVRNNVRHKAKIKNKLYLRWAVFGSTIRHLALLILTLLLNLFVIVLFDVPENFNTNSNYTIITDPVVPVWYSNYLLYILGAFHLILSLWMVSEYFVREFPNLLFGLPLITQTIYDVKKWSDRYEILRRLRSALNLIFCGGKVTEIKKPVSSQCFEVYFFSFAPLYRILFVLFSIAALGTSGYFYCGCILYVFLKNDVLHQVLTAVRRSAAQLISVALLGLGVLLIFAVISFVFLHNFFDNNNNFCRSMIECYVSVIREGLLDTLGTMIPVQYDQNNPSFTVYWARAIFDIIFFVIVTTLGLNIVVAILVDRFSELRSERDEIKKDKLNYCFVCGIDNDTFERKAKGFRHHVLNDHNMWNYIYFLLHLDSMYTNDHNALEKYVNDNIQGRRINFFPLRKAKVIGGRVADSAVQPS